MSYLKEYCMSAGIELLLLVKKPQNVLLTDCCHLKKSRVSLKPFHTEICNIFINRDRYAY